MDDTKVCRFRYERERKARELAERLLEQKSRDLYLAKQMLEDRLKHLSHLVEEQTKELSQALRKSDEARLLMQKTEAELLLSERKFRTIVEGANDIIFMTDTDGVITYFSPRLREVLGCETLDLLGKHFSDLIFEEDVSNCLIFFDKLMESYSGKSVLEYRVLNADGALHWHEANMAPMFDVDDKIIALLGIARDVQDRKTNEQALYKLANFDTLTGLANRKLILEQLEKELVFARQMKRNLAVLFLDLNNFKSINDTHGHAVGDQVLRTTATRLLMAVKSCTDSVGRLAGDEFLVILPDIGDKYMAERVCNRIKQSVVEAISVKHRSVITDVSIGVSMYPLDGTDVDTLVGHADTAMYMHKANKLGKAVFY